MKQQLKLPLPLHSFMLQFPRVYITFNVKTHLDETDFFSFFLNSMSCHHIILHGMLINVHEISTKLLLGVALQAKTTLFVVQHFNAKTILFMGRREQVLSTCKFAMRVCERDFEFARKQKQIETRTKQRLKILMTIRSCMLPCAINIYTSAFSTFFS